MLHIKLEAVPPLRYVHEASTCASPMTFNVNLRHVKSTLRRLKYTLLESQSTRDCFSTLYARIDTSLLTSVLQPTRLDAVVVQLACERN